MDPLAGTALQESVEAYTQIGEHRTGSGADRRTAAWLAEALRRTGCAVAAQTFPARDFTPEQVHVTWDGGRVRGFPLWPPVTTPAAGIVAPLRRAGAGGSPGPGAIAVVRLPYHRAADARIPEYASRIDGAVRAGARAVVAITEGPTGEVIALNAPADVPARPVPVMLAAGRDAAALEAAAGRGARGRFVQTGGARDAPGHNVIARRGSDGGESDQAGDWIVVSTPHSGWFRCGGERGPGIALLLGLARATAERTRGHRPGPGLVFVATSGHELGGAGARRFLAEGAPRPGRVRLWLHLGAGIATWRWRQTPDGLTRLDRPDERRFLVASPELVPALRRAFAGQPGLEDVADATRARAAGEVALFLRAGYRPAAGLFAGHTFHHTPADGAEMTGPSLLEPVARALAATLDAFL